MKSYKYIISNFYLYFFIILITFIIITPQVDAFRTLACCGGGDGYTDDFKPSVDNAGKYLDDEWNWQTGGTERSQGHYKEKKISEDDFVNAVLSWDQSQIVVHAGHGNEANINVGNGDTITGYEIDGLKGEGNMGEGGDGAIPGTIFLFTACESSKQVENGICWNAQDAGARLAMGHDGEVKTAFMKYLSKWFAKKVSQDSAHKIDQISGKAYSAAKSDCGWFSWFGIPYPGYRSYIISDSWYHKPRKEYDFDNSRISLIEGGSLTCGGDASSNVPNDDGAILYIHGLAYPDELRNIKVEYKSSESDTWHLRGTYELAPNQMVSGVNCESEPIVIRFYDDDDDVKDSYFKVRMTAVDGLYSIIHFRVHIVAE